jgi:hypothetical protein
MNGRILTSASVIALMTAAGVSGVRADTVTQDLVPPLTLTMTKNASTIDNQQVDTASKLSATNATTKIGTPTSGFTDYSNTLQNLTVGPDNKGFATAISNTVFNGIDFINATSTTKAATIGSQQITSTLSTMTATVTGATAHLGAMDLAAGSSLTASLNVFDANAFGNIADNIIAGDIEATLNSTELGSSSLDPTELVSGGAAHISNVQVFSVAGTPTAEVVDSTIDVQAIIDDKTTALTNGTLVLTNNSMTADIIANDAESVISIDNDGELTFQGAAGVSSFQYAAGTTTVTASLSEARMEIGDMVLATPTADLVGGTVTLSGNDLVATAGVNAADNQVGLAAGLSLDGVATSAQQKNDVSATTQTSTVVADLFIHSTQQALTDSSASVAYDGTAKMDGIGVVLGETSGGAKITISGNEMGAVDIVNEASNLIDVADAVTFSGTAAIQGVQVLTEDHSASVGKSVIAASLATTTTDAGNVANTTLTVADNDVYSKITGNTQDSLLEIDGTDISGVGVLGAPPATVDRDGPPTSTNAAADFTVMSAQVVDQGTGTVGITSSTKAALDIDLANIDVTKDSSVSATDVTVSGNKFSASTTGNRSTLTGADIDAVDFTGTVAVINDQTVQSKVAITATMQTPLAAYVDILSTSKTFSDLEIDVTGTAVSAEVFGNIAEDNVLNVSGSNTVADGDAAGTLTPSASVARNDEMPLSTGKGSFVLVNDQSVEDTEDKTVSASISGSSASIVLGTSANTTLFSDVTAEITDTERKATGSLNEATSSISVSAPAIDGSAILVNAQTIADEDDNSKSAALSVNVGGSLTIQAATGGDIIGSSFLVSGNNADAKASGNLADNDIMVVSSGTQTLSSVATGAFTNVSLGSSSSAAGETVLLNDQVSNFLIGITAGGGIVQTIAISDADTVSGGSSTFTDNALTGTAVVNKATNTATLNVSDFDLSDADSQAGVNALNGPVATVASNQQALGVPAQTTQSVLAQGIMAAGISITATEGITDHPMSVTGNTVETDAAVNDVKNTMTVTGGSFETPTTATPTVLAFKAASDDIIVSQGGFVVASRQDNAYSSSSLALLNLNVGVTTPAITSSDITMNGNEATADATGNAANNALTLDFDTNEAQGFVVNVQTSASAQTKTTSETTGLSRPFSPNVAITTSDISSNSNKFTASSTANTAENTLTSTGDSIVGGSGVAPSVKVDTAAAATGIVQVKSDLAIVSQQGAETIAAGQADIVKSTAHGTLDTVAGAFVSGSLSVNNNLVEASGIVHDATNQLKLTATSSIDAASASVLSRQVITTSSSVDVLVDGASFGGAFTTADDAGVVKFNVNGNEVTATATGGEALNSLTATAGTTISGTVAAPTASLGASQTMNANFNVLNVQVGDPTSIDSELDTVSAVVKADNGTDPSGFDNDTISINNNTFSAVTRGFTATNTLMVDAKNGNSASGLLANMQDIDGALTSKISGATVRAQTDTEVLNTQVGISNNVISADTAINDVQNLLLVGGDSYTAPAGAVTAGPTASVANAQFAVLNSQNATGSASAAATGTVIADFSTGGAVDWTNSKISVSGNEVTASVSGNSAYNGIGIESGTFSHPTAAIVNSQTLGGSVSATVSNVTIGASVAVDGGTGGGSVTVSGNTVGAAAVGNSAVNIIGSQ